jgi:hypothetical protein
MYEDLYATVQYVLDSEGNDFEEYMDATWGTEDFTLANGDMFDRSIKDPDVDHPYATAIKARRKLDEMCEADRVAKPLYLTVDQLTALVA